MSVHDVPKIGGEHRVLRSGRHTDVYVDKFALVEQPLLLEQRLDDLAYELRFEHAERIVSPLSASVIGYGLARRMDLAFSAAEERTTPNRGWHLRSHFGLRYGCRVIVVDDVVTTGGTLRALHDYLHGVHQCNIMAYAALVLRLPRPDTERYLYAGVEVDAPSWPEEECPSCST